MTSGILIPNAHNLELQSPLRDGLCSRCFLCGEFLTLSMCS